jgi:hypothetical protein
MVKVIVDNNRGLVQETGTGSVEIRDSSGLKVFNPHMNARLHVVTGTGTAADDASSTTITDLVPVGSVVLCGEVAVETASAGGNSVNITSVGVTGDVDAFGGNIALDYNAVGSQVLSPTAMMPVARDGSDSAVSVIVTHGDVGTQSTAAVVRVSLFCASADVTGYVFNP